MKNLVQFKRETFHLFKHYYRIPTNIPLNAILNKFIHYL